MFVRQCSLALLNVIGSKEVLSVDTPHYLKIFALYPITVIFYASTITITQK